MVQPANKRLVTEASLAVAIDAEAALARNADNLTSGTVADARIPTTIARVADVEDLVSDEAALARNANNLTSGTIPDARISASITRDTELAAEAALARNADNLTSGTVADARIPSTITRDSEMATAIANAIASSITNGDTTHAPSGDAVFDALAAKAPLSNPVFAGIVDMDGASQVLVPTEAVATNNTKAASTAFVQSALVEAAAAIPPGVIAPFAGTTPPAGWLLCDGSARNKTTYAALYSVLGPDAFDNDLTDSFYLPNLEGRIPVGIDDTQTEFDTRGYAAGVKTVTLTSAQIPAHTHPITGSVTRYTAGAEPQPVRVASISSIGSSSGYSDSGATGNNTGGGGAHTNLQPYMALHYIIKY